ncbi:MAG: hypothetical protein H0W69_10775 [Gemmatimonadaceae bacterium]|nr:hypothetical protein [Gemmatimonadaceae bacterium]
MTTARPKSRDLSAALTGLVLGVVSLFLIVTTIVLLTNAHFKSEKGEGTKTSQH